MKRKLIANISWLFFDKMIRVLGGLFIGIWIARYLGPSDFGVLNYALAYTAFFMIFVKLGLDQLVVREIVKTPKLANYLLGTAFGLKLIGSLIAMISVYLSLFFVELDYVTKFVIFITSAGFILQSVDIIDYFFQAKLLSKYVVVARNIAFILSGLLKIYFILNNYDVTFFALASFIDAFIVGVFLIVFYKLKGNEIKEWKFSKKISISLLKNSWPLAISMLLISIHLKVDQVMIGSMLDITQVGIYSVAVRLSEFWLFIPIILVSTLMPYLVNLREIDNKKYHFRLMQLYSLMFWMGVIVGVITVVFGESIIILLFGEMYIDAYIALSLNIWAGVFMAQSGAKGIWVISENKQVYRVILNLIAVIVNISLNVWLIPKYGISGAALATLFTVFINNWVTPLFIKPYRENTIVSIKSVNPWYVLKNKA